MRTPLVLYLVLIDSAAIQVSDRLRDSFEGYTELKEEHGIENHDCPRMLRYLVADAFAEKCFSDAGRKRTDQLFTMYWNSQVAVNAARQSHLSFKLQRIYLAISIYLCNPQLSKSTAPKLRRIEVSVLFSNQAFSTHISITMALQHVTLSKFLYFCTPAAVTGLTYGWEVGSMGGILAMPQFLDYFDNPSAFFQGLMTVLLIAGEIFGSLIVGLFISDRFGRRKTALMSVVAYIIGQAILVAAQDRAMFLTGRFLNGFGAGPMFQVVSL